MSLFQLSEVEAFRAQVLLDEALRKLQFLTSISNNNPGHGDELTQFMGDEISRIIQEQRDLERKYEELIAARSQLKGLMNKAKYQGTQREIQDVAHRLKESNKSLCRNLKENPNVQGNLLKMQAERSQVQDWFEEAKGDLAEASFANLVSKVEAERRDQERLKDVKRKEREVSQIVKQREAELQREHQDNEKETKQANQEIKELKEELQKEKTISDIQFKFEEKKLRAREQALLRLHAQMEKALLEELEQLRAAQETEQTVHERAQGFLEEKLEEKQREKEKWAVESEEDLRKRDGELSQLRERQAATAEELRRLEERRAVEVEADEAKDAEKRHAIFAAKAKQEQELRMQEAVLFLQEEGRKYMQRLAVRRASSKGKKKKGKKGK